MKTRHIIALAVLFLLMFATGCDDFMFFSELDGPDGFALTLEPSSATVPILSFSRFQASGGAPPYTFKAASGDVKQKGSDTCEYKAPAATGVDNLQVTDSRGNQYRIDVSVITTGPLRISPSSMSVIMSNFASFTGSGGVPPYRFTATDGAIDNNSGAYTAPAYSCTDTITVVDAEGSHDSAEVTVTSTGPLAITPSAITLVTSGSITLAAIGGDPPYSFTITGGGGTLNHPIPPFGSTVEYTAPGTSGLATVRVEDSLSAFREADITIVSTSALTISPSSISLLVDSQVSFSAFGGDVPYTFSSDAGTIDPVSGAYTAPSAVPVPNPTTITVEDGGSDTDTASVTIFEALSVTPLSIEIPVDSTYQFSASGGFGSYSYTKISGIGNINGSGLFTAPSDIGVAVVQVEDDIGNRSQASITVNSPGPLSISPVSAQLHLGAGLQLFASGGKAPYSFSLLSGSGDIGADTGYYTAPTISGTENIRVTDDLGSTANATIEVVWNMSTVDPNDAGEYVDLELDASGYAHMSYYSASGQKLKYAFWDGAGWSTQTVDGSSDVGQYTSLALDGDGHPHISYYDLNNERLKYATYDGGWTISAVDSAGKVGKHSSIAVDGSDEVHISYWHEDDKQLRYAHYDGSWSIEVVDTAGETGEYTSIAVDDSHRPHISYYDRDTKDLKYATYDGGWSRTTLESSGKVGQYTSIAVDDGNNVHISYWHEDNKELRYAYYDGSWFIETVDSGDVGMYTSIALDGDDPLISYRDNVSKQLKIAVWNGADWDIQTVYDEGPVTYTAIASDPSGKPRLAFYDDTNQDLMFAD